MFSRRISLACFKTLLRSFFILHLESAFGIVVRFIVDFFLVLDIKALPCLREQRLGNFATPWSGCDFGDLGVVGWGIGRHGDGLLDIKSVSRGELDGPVERAVLWCVVLYLCGKNE